MSLFRKTIPAVVLLTLAVYFVHALVLMVTHLCVSIELRNSNCICAERGTNAQLLRSTGNSVVRVRSSFEETESKLVTKDAKLNNAALLEKEYNTSNSIAGHTGPGIPKIVRELLKTKAIGDEYSDTFDSDKAAVDALEGDCDGLDGLSRELRNESCLAGLKFDSAERDPLLSVKLADLVDIVLPSIRNLDFLEDWRDFIEPLHIIIIQDGDPSKILNIPKWADYELYNRHDIETHLDRHRSSSISNQNRSIQNFGFLLSRKRYIFTLDENCLPATDAKGNRVNAIAEHVRNLMKPATPYFFNTLYDPYRPGRDFVRGYPFSLREGVPTVISHGLWLNVPDYDAPTRLLKLKERNVYYDDVVMTIPRGTLYPMSSINVAFDRKLIGPAFMQGLTGDGKKRDGYEDMFAGWCSKVILDHLGYGVKTGAPYIYYNKVSNPFTNLKREYKGFWWQEDVIAFFQQVKLSANVSDAATAYRELSHMIEDRFASEYPYFETVAKNMRYWLDILNEVDSGKITFKPSKSSKLGRERNSDDLTNSVEVSKDPDCLTYEERYRRCRTIRRMPLNEQRKRFHQASMGYLATEAAILRLSNIEWPEDFWLNVCAFVLETGEDGTRIPVLQTNKDTIKYVPWEFKSLVRVQDDEIMKLIMSEYIFISGYLHGDQLAAMWLILERPELDFVWVFENDIRYSGHYGKMLAQSRKWAFENPGINSTAMPELTEPHLITFTPPIVERHWPFISRHRVFQGEFHKYSKSSQFFGTFIPMFGMSRYLATKMIEENIVGNSHDSLEGNAPCVVLSVLDDTGYFPKVSFVPLNSAIYYSVRKWKDVKMHRPWMEGQTFTDDHFTPTVLDTPFSLTWHPHPTGTTFAGKNCLANYLMHPVKLIAKDAEGMKGEAKKSNTGSSSGMKGAMETPIDVAKAKN